MRLWRREAGDAVRSAGGELVERRARTHEWQPERVRQPGQRTRDGAVQLADDRHDPLGVQVFQEGCRAIRTALCVAHHQLNELSVYTRCLVEVLDAKLQPSPQVTPGRNKTRA
jgi:hypothetical protein